MDKRGAQWIGTPQIKGSTESIRMMLLTFSLIGLQFTWGIEMTYCTPYLLQLGLTKSKLSLVWIAGPLSGLIMQPIVGIYADKSKSKYGRRRPVMVVGAVIVSICLLILGWAGEIVGRFVTDAETKREATIVLAVLMIYVLDFAINGVQSSCRSLIVDSLPIPKQQLGSAWASRMVAVGHLIGYGAGALNLSSIFGTLIGDTQFKQLIVIAAFALVAAVAVTCWATTERVLVSDGDSGSTTIWSTFAEIFHTTRHLPNRIQAVCWIQFWSWIGWFPFLFYSTTWVGETFLRYEAPASVRNSKDTLGDIGRLGSTSLIVFSMVTFIGSLTFPSLVESPEDTSLHIHRSSFTPRPPTLLAPVLNALPSVQKPTLLTAWILGHLTFASTMVFAPLVTSVHSATLLVAICGIPWALASWAPFTFMGVEINRLSTSLPTSAIRGNGRVDIHEAEILHLRSGSASSTASSVSRPATPTPDRRGGRAGGNSSTGELAGIYLGILNLYTTVPQLIATMISWVVFGILEPGKSAELSDDVDSEGVKKGTEGPNAIAVCLFIGAICSVVAAYATRRLKYVR